MSSSVFCKQQATVLIVDDTPANLAIAVEALEHRDYGVLIAREGEEGIERARHAQPDLILLDIAMPGIDGFEVCRRLKTLAATAEIPVMFMTAYSDREHELQGFAAGAVDYVTKPLRIEEVVARVDAHVKLHVMRRQLEANNAQLAREIDERREAEQALERQRAFLRQVVDIIPHCIFVKDYGGRFRLANRAFADHLGVAVSDIIGKTAEDFRGSQGARRLRPDDFEVLRTGCETVIEADRYTTAAGEPRIFRTIKRALPDREGRPRYILGVATDVTARHKAELALQEHQDKLEQEVARRTVDLAETNRRLREEVFERQRAEAALREAHARLEARVAERTRELQQANQELESFSYSVSHDLRAPLRAIAGFAQILGQSRRERLDEEGLRYLENVIVAAKHMGVLIDDLLQYARIGRGAVRAVPVPLAPLLQRIQATFADRIDLLGARIEWVEPMATPVGDPTLIEQVLTNLLDNGLTYHGPGQRTSIRISAERQGLHVLLRVADQGIGIAPEYHERIFQVFQRLHGEGESEYPGTGIGLAIVAKAVRLMDGLISVDSQTGHGSTFCVRLRSADAQADSAHREASPASSEPAARSSS